MLQKLPATRTTLPLRGPIAAGIADHGATHSAPLSATQSADPLADQRVGRTIPREAGFTLLEVLVVVVIIGFASILVVPNLINETRKQRTRGFLTETTNFLLAAKQEAARRGVPVVVEIDTTENRLFAFANVDGDADLQYQPDTSVAYRTVDYEVRRLDLPTSGNAFLMDFWGPTDGTPRGAGMSTGMTTNGAGDSVFVFNSDGSVRDVGGLRLSDINHVNSFEIQVAPAATGHIRLLKYNSTSAFSGPGFLPRGNDETTGKNYWTWY